MNAEYYDIIFKRKSFHLFRDTGNESLSKEELEDIQKGYGGFESLYPGIRTAMRIVPASSVNVGRDAEYCLLLYS
ncbi:MAG: nitroreductase, partial [Firmicutes bacterium]|nr:nitroreductase [Bacillota bacterium]